MRLQCSCSKCRPDLHPIPPLTLREQRNVQDASDRLLMVRDLVELERGHAGVKLTVADIAPHTIRTTP